MKIKTVLYTLCIVIAGGLCSCVDDLGNYDYLDRDSIMPIEILGLKDTTFRILSEVNLAPELKGMEDESLYDFAWFTYADGTSDANRDTLGCEKNLNFIMTYAPGMVYSLVYEIREKSTGLVVNKRVKISGASEYSKGWFVLKDENGQTDVDFVSVGGVVDNNLLLKATGRRMEGQAVKLMYQSSGYYHQVRNPDGTLTVKSGLKAMHILSGADIWAVNPDDFSIYKDYEEVYYIAPGVRRPQNVFMLSKDLFLIDNGNIMSIYGMGINLGKVGYPKLGAEDLHSDALITGSVIGSPVVFSRKSRSFLTTSALGTELDNCMEQTAGYFPDISPINMNADLVCMINRKVASLSAKGWAIMKSVTGPREYYLADLNFNYGSTYPFADFDTISSARTFTEADVYGTHFLNNFYFAKGNVLSYYQKNDSDANSVEKTNIWPNFASNEQIVYISQMESNSPAFNYLVILTNSPDGWRMYRFTLKGNGTSPEIDQLVEPVYQGKGNACNLIFRQ